MKIAIIGSGISGLSSAWYLHPQHEVTVFEANGYVGGHTATVDVSVVSGDYAIDTGFIVFNDRTYPLFERFLADLGLSGQPSEMSFSVRNDEAALEYNGHSLSTLFAQRRNLLRPRFYRLIAEILRFNRLAKAAVDHTELGTLGQFLHQHGFGADFCDNYILPMGAAIWSSSLTDMRGFPLALFLRFFLNHGLLDVKDRPQWSVIPGGSREYVRKVQAQLGARIRTATPVQQVKRWADRVELTTAAGVERFDQVIFACHSDQALALLADPSEAERAILSAMPYQNNEVVLHTDTRLLPRRRKAWAAWNYHLGEAFENGVHRDHRQATLTYNMNILQGISAPETFCVTLNQTDKIDPERILRRFHYAHPMFSADSARAQSRRHEINGHRRSWFCGAYWYNGFHEDGIRSGMDVVSALQGLDESAQPEPKWVAL
ncbi:NAD(P)/FAD-dependent oxidoreductase [Ferrimonas pelagia]|uniref:NAD(P)/FAD-dependent oxidoreductase n=1 Tax=Ferrimonas pelagia TaxID=1177826 RepID=A0ABP9FD89_9GAMM